MRKHITVGGSALIKMQAKRALAVPNMPGTQFVASMAEAEAVPSAAGPASQASID